MQQSHLVKTYGRWAVVTGASDGIGKAFAEQLAEKGMNVLLVARRYDRLFHLCADIEEKFNVEAVPLALDLAEPSAMETLAFACQGRDIGMLVAAAGFGTSGPFTKNAITEEINMLDVNCRAVTQQVHFFASRFSQQKRGAILLFSSIVAFQGVPLSSVYAATKAYIQTLGEGLYIELKTYGIDVLILAPGPVDTGFALRAGLSPGKLDDPCRVAQESIAALGKTMTLRPGIVSKVLAMLLSVPRFARIKIMTKVMAGMVND